MMANLGNNVKTAFLKGLEALGKGAASITESAQQKLSEMKLDERRTEIRRAIPTAAAELWKDGVELPEKLNVLVEELVQIEEQLAAMRAKPEPADDETPADEECAVKDALETLGDKVEAAIDSVEAFVEEKAEKVEDAVENMVDSFRKPDETEENRTEEENNSGE